jgi:hypothetical protein
MANDEQQQQQPDLSDPSAERQAELRAAFHVGSDTPYLSVALRTLGEMDCIFAERR